MKKLFFFALLFTASIYISSCYKDNLSELTPASGVTKPICDTSGVISFSTQVVPILQNNCGTNNTCHNTGNSNSGYDLSIYSGVNAQAANGNLVNAISWTGNVPQMPQNGLQISSCDIATIKKWVDAGHLNN
jgi:hypothetical protein